MTKIERRTTVIHLYRGGHDRRLKELSDRALAALRDEESGVTPKRAGTKSEANKLAKEWEVERVAAEEDAVAVELAEISNTDWQRLADEHPPRDGNDVDKRHGVNMETFPAALLSKSLGDSDIELGDLSRVHYVKLERGAWDLHSEDDALPKYSLVSRLTQLRDPDSRPQNDSE